MRAGFSGDLLGDSLNGGFAAKYSPSRHVDKDAAGDGLDTDLQNDGTRVRPTPPLIVWPKGVEKAASGAVWRAGLDSAMEIAHFDGATTTATPMVVVEEEEGEGGVARLRHPDFSARF